MTAGTLPLTVIGGFLGAGKTSLVNHLLRVATRPIGLVSDDPGALDIGTVLIDRRQGESLTTGTGCVCCEMGNHLPRALQLLKARRPAVEAIIVEASGIADPWRTAQAVLLEPDYELAPLVVVVDASRLVRQLQDVAIAPTIRQQLAHAELVVLNRAECPGELADAGAAVSAIRPQARQVAAIHGRVAPADLCFAPPARPRASRLRADAPNGFRIVYWHCPGPLDPVRLRAALGALPPAVLRVQGSCEIGKQASPHWLHYAAGSWDITPVEVAVDAPGFTIIGTAALPHIASLFDGDLLA